MIYHVLSYSYCFNPIMFDVFGLFLDGIFDDDILERKSFSHWENEFLVFLVQGIEIGTLISGYVFLKS